MAEVEQYLAEYEQMLSGAGIASSSVVSWLSHDMENFCYQHDLSESEWHDIFTYGFTPLLGTIIDGTPSSVKSATDKDEAWNQVSISIRQSLLNQWTHAADSYLSNTIGHLISYSGARQVDNIDAKQKGLVYDVSGDPNYHILFVMPFVSLVPEAVDVYLGDTQLTSKSGPGPVTFQTAGKVMPANLIFRPNMEILTAYRVYYGETQVYSGTGAVTLLTNGKLCSDDIQLSTSFD